MSSLITRCDINPIQATYGSWLRVNEWYRRAIFKGVLAGYLGANFTSGPITEWQIDTIKENISHYCEATIDIPHLKYQEKEEQKRKM